MKRLGLAKHLVTEISGRVIRRAEVNVTAEDLTKFDDHLAEPEHARRLAGEELDENVDVTFRREPSAQQFCEP